MPPPRPHSVEQAEEEKEGLLNCSSSSSSSRASEEAHQDQQGGGEEVREETKVVVLPLPAGATSDEKHPSCPSSSSSSCDGSGKDKEQNYSLCRICLEEDVACNLEQPCSCSGTQRFAHHDCIQRWVNEKGNTRCEICDCEYVGEFTVPEAVPLAADTHMPMFAPLYLVNGENHAIGTRGNLDYGNETEQYYQRHPGMSWWVRGSCVGGWGAPTRVTG